MDKQKGRVREQVRAKLPELLLEAVSVVFAVLVALAANEWRQNLADKQVAHRALTGIAEEMRASLEEFGSGRESLDRYRTPRAGKRGAAHSGRELPGLTAVVIGMADRPAHRCCQLHGV